MRPSRGFVFGLTFPLWTFTAPFSMLVWTLVEGQVRVIGSSQLIMAALGEDVILPCHLEPEFNVQALTVEWSRPDLKSDPWDELSEGEYVHIYRNRQVVPETMAAYIGRTKLFTDSLRRGNISLKILNVSLSDQGRYKCFVPRLKSAATIELVVDTNFGATTETSQDHRNLQTPEPNDRPNVESGRLRHGIWVSAVVVCIVVFLGGGVAFLLQHKFQEKKHSEYSAAPLKQLTV
uniref:myelin-oligodendrocyte glycoprotein-like isoform X2 n=1 Tax=Semicossyphus pulcher TaxID=241346 RepID=UPI0037E840F2